MLSIRGNGRKIIICKIFTTFLITIYVYNKHVKRKKRLAKHFFCFFISCFTILLYFSDKETQYIITIIYKCNVSFRDYTVQIKGAWRVTCTMLRWTKINLANRTSRNIIFYIIWYLFNFFFLKIHFCKARVRLIDNIFDTQLELVYINCLKID